MGKAKKTKKIKKMIRQRDERIKVQPKHVVQNYNKLKHEERKKKEKLTQIEPIPSSLFFAYNNALGPPYRVLLDTNFINFSIQHKTDIMRGLMDCLLAKSYPCVTDCVVAELEKMGHKYQLALKTVKDPRFKRLTCTHTGTYADDCIMNRVQEHRCYIVATNDKDLKKRIRKVPGVPIIYVTKKQYKIERLPDSIK